MHHLVLELLMTLAMLAGAPDQLANQTAGPAERQSSGFLCGAVGQACCGCLPDYCCDCDPGLVAILGFCAEPSSCGGSGQICCSPGCTCDSPWLQQYAGICGPCGGNGEPFCINGAPCQPGLSNVAGICSSNCGGDGEVCCPPSCTCEPWLQQYFGICGPCGGHGEPICLGTTPCQPGLQNTAGLCLGCDPCNPACAEFDACLCAGVHPCTCKPCEPWCSPECDPLCDAFDPCNCEGGIPCLCDPCSEGCFIYYVAGGSIPPGDGSFGTPFPSITAAANAAGDCGNVIRIAGGVYAESLKILNAVQLGVQEGSQTVRIIGEQ